MDLHRRKSNGRYPPTPIEQSESPFQTEYLTSKQNSLIDDRQPLEPFLSATHVQAREELTGVVDELRELTIVVDKEMHHPVEDEYTDSCREGQDPVLPCQTCSE